MISFFDAIRIAKGDSSSNAKPQRTSMDGTEGPPRAWVIEEVRDEAGETIAVKICSALLEAHLWILNDPDFIPPDDDPVFFAHDFEYLETKSIEDLKGALKAKIAFPRARVVQ